MGTPPRGSNKNGNVQVGILLSRELAVRLDRMVAQRLLDNAGTTSQPPNRASVVRTALIEYLDRHDKETSEETRRNAPEEHDGTRAPRPAEQGP